MVPYTYDGMIPYSMARRLITETVREESEVLIYQGIRKTEMAGGYTQYNDIIIETLDIHYMELLRNLDNCNTI